MIAGYYMVMIPAMMMLAAIPCCQESFRGPGASVFFFEDWSGGQLQPKVQFYRLKPRCGRVQDGAAMIVIDRGITPINGWK